MKIATAMVPTTPVCAYNVAEAAYFLGIIARVRGQSINSVLNPSKRPLHPHDDFEDVRILAGWIHLWRGFCDSRRGGAFFGSVPFTH